MFGNFFKDRIIDWGAILMFFSFGLLIAAIVGWVGLSVWCLKSGFTLFGIPVGVLVFTAPFVAFAGYAVLDVCFPKAPAEASRRRARRLEKAARKAEARMRDMAMKRHNLTNYARWDNNA